VWLLAKNLLFTVVAPGTVGVYLPLWIAGGRTAGPAGAVGLAFALFALGGAIYAWCVWDFASFGRGTPAPIDAPKQLVVRGLYRAIRNPMYVGVLCVVLGWALYYASAAIALYACVVWTVFHAFVRLYEEPHLSTEFGSEYERYCARVGRWLPRLRPADPQEPG
jgi:protein-S-isoprenylcysteine O-methyltransferase Ste14